MYKSKCPALSICIYAIMNVEWLFMIFIIGKLIFFTATSVYIVFLSSVTCLGIAHCYISETVFLQILSFVLLSDKTRAVFSKTQREFSL